MKREGISSEKILLRGQDFLNPSLIRFFYFRVLTATRVLEVTTKTQSSGTDPVCFAYHQNVFICKTVQRWTKTYSTWSPLIATCKLEMNKSHQMHSHFLKRGSQFVSQEHNLQIYVAHNKYKVGQKIYLIYFPLEVYLRSIIRTPFVRFLEK